MARGVSVGAFAPGGNLWHNTHSRGTSAQPIRSRGAAGAQVPYKHKVGGSNPSATTRSIRRSSLGFTGGGLFGFQGSLLVNVPIVCQRRKNRGLGALRHRNNLRLLRLPLGQFADDLRGLLVVLRHRMGVEVHGDGCLRVSQFWKGGGARQPGGLSRVGRLWREAPRLRRRRKASQTPPRSSESSRAPTEGLFSCPGPSRGFEPREGAPAQLGHHTGHGVPVSAGWWGGLDRGIGTSGRRGDGSGTVLRRWRDGRGAVLRRRRDGSKGDNAAPI